MKEVKTVQVCPKCGREFEDNNTQHKRYKCCYCNVTLAKKTVIKDV